MKFYPNKFLLLLALFMPIHFIANAGLLYELSLKQKVEQSHSIVSGTVSSIYTYRNENNTIMTQYMIEVENFFKNTGENNQFLEINTFGGFIDSEGALGDCYFYPSLNDYGIFFVHTVNGVNHLYGENQGIIKIDKQSGNYTDYFNIYENGKNTFLPELLALCPKNNASQHLTNSIHTKNIASVNISSIQPLIETAGTGAVVTIKGFGLGANQYEGTLFFTNANDGGSTFISVPNELIVKWTSTEIIAKIPSQAGTGKIRIETNAGFDVSGQTLTITAARINTGENNPLYEARLVKRNANGGYLLKMNEKFNADSNVTNHIKNAIQNWRCHTGVNWTLGKPTNNSGTGRDTINTISFDDLGQLPAGAIGLCYSYYKSCGSNVWYVDEFDMIFKENFNWYFGNGIPAQNEYDFYTVALHEFGHAHQLAHVIKPSDLMHYSINPGQEKREISDENSDLCYDIISESIAKNTCDFAAHLAVPPAVCSDALFGYFVPGIYPNPAKDSFTIDLFLTNNDPVTLQIFNFSGQQILEKTYTPSGAERVSIEVNLRENGLNAGVYVLKIFSKVDMATQKIILY